MTDKQKKLMEELLQENLLVSTGCTEPIAIAYASAIAKTVSRGRAIKDIFTN